MQIYEFGKRRICFGYDKSSIHPHKSGQSNKQIQHFNCWADSSTVQTQDLLRSTPLIPGPLLFTCATDHTQTTPCMNPSFEVCECVHLWARTCQRLQRAPCARDYAEYLSLAPSFRAAFSSVYKNWLRKF